MTKQTVIGHPHNILDQWGSSGGEKNRPDGDSVVVGGGGGGSGGGAAVALSPRADDTDPSNVLQQCGIARLAALGTFDALTGGGGWLIWVAPWRPQASERLA